jgi:hypothetical protein
METYKLIRKICLWLTATGGVVVIVETVVSVPDEFILVLSASVGFYIGVYIIFEVISKLMQSVKKDRKNLKVFSDKQYLEAYSEVEENNIQNKELWAKAFAQCGGDKEKQKSIYVELRTKELSKG